MWSARSVLMTNNNNNLQKYISKSNCGDRSTQTEYTVLVEILAGIEICDLTQIKQGIQKYLRNLIWWWAQSNQQGTPGAKCWRNGTFAKRIIK